MATLRAVAPEVMPWGTHAYIISAQTAERMALTAGLMVARSRLPADGFHTTAWQLDGEDIKIDHYLSLFYSELTPQADRQRCGGPTPAACAWNPSRPPCFCCMLYVLHGICCMLCIHCSRGSTHAAACMQVGRIRFNASGALPLRQRELGTQWRLPVQLRRPGGLRGAGACARLGHGPDRAAHLPRARAAPAPLVAGVSNTPHAALLPSTHCLCGQLRNLPYP